MELDYANLNDAFDHGELPATIEYNDPGTLDNAYNEENMLGLSLGNPVSNQRQQSVCDLSFIIT